MAYSSAYLGNAVEPAGLRSFWFLRHGPTPANIQEDVDENGVRRWIAQGAGSETSLTRDGEILAKAAGSVFLTEPITQVFCSPLKRTVETAQLAFAGRFELKYDTRLIERDFGKHEGKLLPIEAYRGKWEGVQDPEEFSLVVASALQLARQEGTVFVSHGGVLRVIAGLLGVTLQQEHLRNASPLFFRKSGSDWTVTMLNTKGGGVPVQEAQTDVIIREPPSPTRTTSPKSKVILISGANRGIGLATAWKLFGEGYRLSLGARDPSKLQDEFGPQTDKLHYARFEADGGKICEATREAWVASAFEKFGRIDGLVNNAGKGARGTVNLNSYNVDGLKDLMNVNVIAGWHLTILCLPHLKRSGAGRVIHINSLSGLRVKESENLGYNVSKFALRGLADTTQSTCWEHGVRVTSIHTGWVRTDMTTHTTKIARNDMTSPEEVADAVAFALERSNKAAVPEIVINCELEPAV